MSACDRWKCGNKYAANRHAFKSFWCGCRQPGDNEQHLVWQQNFGYYETVCGGCGAGEGEGFNGASAVHHHMTNTRITDPEIQERGGGFGEPVQ